MKLVLLLSVDALHVRKRRSFTAKFQINTVYVKSIEDHCFPSIRNI
jgi:hypothetical protein